MPKKGYLRPSVRSVEERNALVTQWLDLVPWAIHEKFPSLRRAARLLGFSDALQEGRMGLIRAAELWEPGRASFSHYAIFAIRHRIFHAMTVRRRQYPLDMEQVPADFSRKGQCQSIAQLIASESAREAVVILLGALREQKLRTLIIVAERFRLFGRTGKTLSELATLFRITRERVRQIELKAMTDLRLAAGPQAASAIGLELCPFCGDWTPWTLPCSQCGAVGCDCCVFLSKLSSGLRCYACPKCRVIKMDAIPPVVPNPVSSSLDDWLVARQIASVEKAIRAWDW